MALTTHIGFHGRSSLQHDPVLFRGIAILRANIEQRRNHEPGDEQHVNVSLHSNKRSI